MLNELTGEAILHTAFESLRPRLLAMIHRRVGEKLASRIDPEGVIHDAYLRARPRWRAMNPKTVDLDGWIFGQVRDRLIEVVRSALGPERDLEREVFWPQGAADPLADALVDPHTTPSAALSRAERQEIVRAALEKLDPIEREIVDLHFYADLNYAQIGPILGLSQNAVTKRGLRAAMKLRRLIPSVFRPPGASSS